MFFKSSKSTGKLDDLVKVAALLIHAAKIDEDYSNKEKEIIKETLLKIGAINENIDKIINSAIKIEENSNQILDLREKLKI